MRSSAFLSIPSSAGVQADQDSGRWLAKGIKARELVVTVRAKVNLTNLKIQISLKISAQTGPNSTDLTGGEILGNGHKGLQDTSHNQGAASQVILRLWTGQV
jgi:hypothetical protein